MDRWLKTKKSPFGFFCRILYFKKQRLVCLNTDFSAPISSFIIQLIIIISHKHLWLVKKNVG
jgi:hypothetical protein